ncbi:MAG TPA: CoA-transferase [Bradyrhizobium sp.]|nr:CoA-transferase [Bradyrhizobium sp.]
MRGGAQPYTHLRQELAKRDRGLREKVVSLGDAASFVRDGDSVGIGGSTMSRTPMALIWALIRAQRKNLSCSRCIISSDGDLLFGSGISDHIISSWFSQSILWGVSKVMRHYTETGKATFEEWSHMAVGMRFRAGAMGLPFMPIRSMLGSDVLGQRPEAKEIECPFTGEKILLVPALNPDVALIHVQRCDAYGNAQIDGLQFMDIDLAMAANKVILTTERIVLNDQIRRAPDQTKIPFFAVDAVVEVPFGCAPHECYGAYEPMMKHMENYVALVNKDPVGGMKEYLDHYVYGPKSWTEFLDLIGLEEILDAVGKGRSIYDD